MRRRMNISADIYHDQVFDKGKLWSKFSLNFYEKVNEKIFKKTTG